MIVFLEIIRIAICTNDDIKKGKKRGINIASVHRLVVEFFESRERILILIPSGELIFS